MAKISTYLIDPTIQDGDKWIGTDSQTNKTRNFTAQGLANNFNQSGKIGVGGQIPFLFYAGSPAGRRIGSISFADGYGENTAFSAVSNIVISKSNSAEINVEDFLEYLSSKTIFIYNLSDINQFAKYNLTTLVERTGDPTFFDATLSFQEGNGILEKNKYYGIVEGSAAGDKEFTFLQQSSSSTWVINHNLGKIPSVTVVDTLGNIIVGDITYNSTNQLTLTFSANITGNAYLN